MKRIDDEEIKVWLEAKGLFQKLLKSMLDDKFKDLIKQVADAQLASDIEYLKSDEVREKLRFWLDTHFGYAYADFSWEADQIINLIIG